MLSNRTFYILFLMLAAVMTVLNLTIAQRDPALFDPLVDINYLVRNKYVADVDDKELVRGAIEGMLGKLDPFSEYIPVEDLDEFNRRTSGVYEGIGIGIDVKDGYITVISPFDGSPAQKAGLRAGDIIIEVEGKSTKGWTASKAQTILTGHAGSAVTVKIARHDGTIETVKIVRDKIRVPSIRGWRIDPESSRPVYLLDKEAGIGYIRITQFIEETVTDFDTAFETLRKEDLKALIIDLRDNPGGLMSAAVQLVDRFIDSGVILSTKGAHSREQVQEAKAPGTYPRYPLVILVNQGSASASEIVSGSLQDHGRAILVGERTWGKGSVQEIIRLPDSEALVKLTTNYYYLPKGRCVHRLNNENEDEWGVKPDIEEPFNYEKAPELRELLTKLNNGVNEADSEKPANDAPEPAAAPEKEVGDLAKELLALDNQLDQAVKQCLGLLHSQGDLAPLGEVLQEVN